MKIGYALEPLRRLRTLSVGSDEPLELIACFRADPEMEDILKFQFRSMRVRGEWYELNNAALAFIAGAQDLWCSRDFARHADVSPDHALHRNPTVLRETRALWRSMGRVDRRRIAKAASRAGLGPLRYLLYETMIRPPAFGAVACAIIETMTGYHSSDLAIVDAKIAVFKALHSCMPAR